MRSRLTQLLALLFALAMVSAACGSDSASETDAADAASDTGSEGAALDCAIESLPLTEAGKLTIATGEPAYEPWMVDDDPTNKQGFEGAVAYAIAEKMGFADADVVWTRSDFDEAIAPGEKPYDFNMQQYSITADRDKVVDFSLPYYSGQKSVIALGGSPAATATNFEELQAGTWGATIGTTDLDYIENTLGIEDVAVYDTQADVLSAMAAGQIDATVVALPTALYLTAVEMDNGVIVGVLPTDPSQTEGDQMGLLFTDGSELVGCVNEAITALTDDGTLEALAVEWLQGEGDIPEIAS
ncbi:MAG: ABC transporter substrate-binding protein [Acidimicrobiales bacterium]